MSKINGLNHIERFSWLLLQSLWVGGIWISILVIYPALNQSLLAPILVYGIVVELGSKVIFATIVCSLLQVLLLVKGAGLFALIKTAIGQGLLIVVTVSVGFLLLHNQQLLDYKSSAFIYITIGLFGVFLMFHLPPWFHRQREVHYD